VGAIVRVYLAWRLFRLLRPLLGVALIVGTVLALSVGHAPVNGSAARTIERGATTAEKNLPRALERAFEPSRR
jgi:hypothetical protein